MVLISVVFMIQAGGYCRPGVPMIVTRCAFTQIASSEQVRDEAEAQLERLKSNEPKEREDATRTLKSLGRRARPALLKAVSDADLEVSAVAKLLLTRLGALDRVTPALLRAMPGLEERLLEGSDHDWTESFFRLSALLEDPQRSGDLLRAEDLEALVKRAFQGATSAKERRELCSAIARRRLRWPTAEALQWAMLASLRATEDFQGISLPEALQQILWKYRIGFAIDVGTLPDPRNDRVAARFRDQSLDGALGLLLGARHLTYVPFQDMIFVTGRSDAMMRGEDPYPKTPLETSRISQLLEQVGRREGFHAELACREIVSQGPKALWPLLESSRKLSGPGAELCRSALATLMTDESVRWVADPTLPSAVSCEVLEASIPGNGALRTLKDWVKEIGLECDFRAELNEPRFLVFEQLPRGSLLKILTRPYGLDFQLKGDLLVIDTASHIKEAPGR
jgi:hypothetical protein